MKLILVGIGSFGHGWYERIKRDYNELEVVVVDKDINSRAKLISNDDKFYTCLKEAIEEEHPDFILNVTPPSVHTAINNIAFDYKIPVLCEKPISQDYNDAIQVVERAVKENIPFMIAENYRREPVIRKIRSLVEKGAIGCITSIQVELYKELYGNITYPLNIENPLLIDVAVHHFDMMRYITKSEGKRVFSKAYNPKGSWFKGNANLYVLLEMENGIIISYTGSVAAKNIQTDWKGSWRIEGTEGTITLVHDTITVIKNNKKVQIKDFDDISSISCLDEFLLVLKEGRISETSGEEYLKTQGIVYFSEQSCMLNKMLDIHLHTMGGEANDY